ncbi:zinc ribbon domain-containing protein [Candidatus Xianfuyuplasma coldseepsis]|uniref:Zinc ribbon domain-containing protein n=1 Tax=Candidatus Xianfuyuplasma coldseepsis TaxID=2782163 RepID=A0A7L7KRR6_9MOLU|nr:zinc ribbon domain-containing protein [Xianfuyuplasma coldseepsis]QMS85520.1 zinc ribbon domain-containing protein [Xianfuyuplasma coldseepsis]
MFCKKCGNQLENDAKFCPSCGEKVQQNYSAPRPFEQHSIDESQNYQYQKSAFKGKQVSTGTSGSISFGNKTKKKGLLGRIIKLAVVAAVIVVIASFFFGGSPITYVESGTGFDAANSELTGKTETFTTTTPEIYILFDYEDLEVGKTLYLNLFYEDETETDASYTMNVEDSVGWGYVSFVPTTTWAVGDYTLEFVIDEELIDTYEFSVE